MADSSTGGFLRPVLAQETTTEIEDILHDFIAGVTGLSGDMVRPKWMAEPAPVPPSGADWCAFGILNEGGDSIGGERHFGEGEGYNIAATHEDVNFLVSFYGRNSRANVKTLRLGLAVAQNREYLYKREMAFVEAGPNTHVPEVVGEVWNDRWDITLRFRRREENRYGVLNLETAAISITTRKTLKTSSAFPFEKD